MNHSAALPSLKLAQHQHAWLRAARSRLLRQCNLLSSQTILELGCGWGLAAIEIAERSPTARVIGIDQNAHAITYAQSQISSQLASRVEFHITNAASLPMEDKSVDLVFCQCSFLWFQDLESVLSEATRVLKKDGWLVALEPDYGGLMEWPEELSLRSIWLESLVAAGAQPLIGRTLFGRLKQLRWTAEARFLDFYESPREPAVEFLRQLPLSETQLQRVELVRRQLQEIDCNYLAHLPFWMITAKPCR